MFANLGSEYDTAFQQIAAVKYYALADIYAHSKISIGINEQINIGEPNPLIIYSKLRDFETTMSGACLLTQATPEQPHLFEIGTDIEVYTSKEELLEKAKELLKSPTKRLAMRAKAREKSLALHTWQHRFEKLFKALNLV
jgi:spore maturation protein CgeB